MEASATIPEHKDRRRVLALLGLPLLLVGVASAFIAPLEIYTLSFFSKGGAFIMKALAPSCSATSSPRSPATTSSPQP